MRIQHNIMAMSAYRNYTNNVSAMKKNLEKLSSGYKINRAGDDAAGLAISEKMRAQITGLETAQKNAKDGISLVQTAEGALTEVHDMLNRMVELATMSANGTYDNTTDRAQLQKEMDQLNKEINRIADSANFNGIKLLDGSMDAEGVTHGTSKPANDGGPQYFVPSTASGANKIAAKGSTLGVHTILHTEAGSATHGTEFAVDLHEVKFDAKKGDTMTITLGSGATAVNLRLTSLKDASKAMTAKDIVKAFGTANTDIKIEVGVGASPASWTEYTPGGKLQIKGTDFTLTPATGTGRLSFKQDAVPAGASEEVLGGMKVTVTSNAAKGIQGNITAAGPTNTTPGTAGTKAVYTYDFTGITGVQKGDYTVNIGGKDVAISFTADEAAAASTASKAAKAVADKVLAVINDGVNPIEFKDGITGTTSNYVVAAGTGAKLTFTASGNGTIAAGNAISGNITITPAVADRTAVDGAHSGDYNVSTTDVNNVKAVADKRLASTVITLTKDMVAKDSAVIIGNTEYVFSTDSADKASENGKVYIGDMVDDKGNLKATADMEEIARRISNSAKDNAVWTVGKTGDADGKITLMEKTDGAGNSTVPATVGGKKVDLTTEEGIAATLGWRGNKTNAYKGDEGKALTLQIGDTADDFNQLEVNIKDMHADMLGKAYKADGKTLDTSVDGYDLTLATISIAKQTDAAKAVDVIKRAINQVSDLRGTLGATQNRLDHTINNLSVMTENIQDAESTIRDVDVAEEMMAYTKNNILIQSAQAMLAQANQVPQGVLQLLQ